MLPDPEKDQNAYVKDLVDSAKQAVEYVRELTFEQFWDDRMARDAVAMRLHVMGEVATKIKAETAAKLGILRVEEMRGMRNRIAHDYGKVNFRIVWKTVREDLPPLISALEKYLRQQKHHQEQAPKIHPAPSVATRPHRPSNGPRMSM
jgi:uncharacterized protein with HEPN domain